MCLPPAQFVVVAAESLLPAEQDQPAEQAQCQLALEPVLGRDAARLQCLPVRGDRGFLRQRQAAAVDRQVPRQVTERRAPAWLLPVEQDSPSLVIGAEVVQLPVAVHECLRRLVQRLDQRARVVGQGDDDRRGGGRDLREQRPALGDEPRHQVRRPDVRLDPGHPRGLLQVAVGRRNHVEFVAAVPEAGVQRRHVPEEAPVLVAGYRIAGRGNQPAGHIAHQHRAAGRSVRPDRDDRLVEAGRQAGEDAPPPQFERRATQPARCPHGPVISEVKPLQHVRLAPDHDAFELCAGLPWRVQRCPFGRLGEQGGEIRVIRRHWPPPSPPAAARASALRTSRCPRRSCRRGP